MIDLAISRFEKDTWLTLTLNVLVMVSTAWIFITRVSKDKLYLKGDTLCAFESFATSCASWQD